MNLSDFGRFSDPALLILAGGGAPPPIPLNGQGCRGVAGAIGPARIARKGRPPAAFASLPGWFAAQEGLLLTNAGASFGITVARMILSTAAARRSAA